MGKEDQIGLLLGEWTDDEKAFANIPSEKANAFLRFAYSWLRLTNEDELESEWNRLDAMRKVISDFSQIEC